MPSLSKSWLALSLTPLATAWGALLVRPQGRATGAKGNAFLQASANSTRDDSDIGRVLYFVYSDSNYYHTRLQWVTDTWAQRVPKNDLWFVGDAEYQGNASHRVVPTDCPRHSHWEGACCKYAMAVRLAYEEMERDPSVHWAYFVDDDAYVRPDQMAAALATQGDPQDHGVALGNLGCATKDCKFSICAGGGYAANRKAIYKSIAGSEEGLSVAEMGYCAKCERWADVAMTQIFLEKHVELRPMDGLNGWKLKKSQFDKSIDGKEPLMYHYIQTQQQMEFLHRLFATGDQAPIDMTDDREQCTDYHGEHRCALSHSPHDTPWVPDGPEALALIEICMAQD